ncbi:MAG: substrate-binding domain-containing protein, partial [Desulfobacterales bacterium]
MNRRQKEIDTVEAKFNRIRSRVFSMAIIVSTMFGLTVSTVFAGEKVIIFHAGSLTVPLAKIEKQFEAANPGIDIQREGGGSTKMARMIADMNKPADIMASADFKV